MILANWKKNAGERSGCFVSGPRYCHGGPKAGGDRLCGVSPFLARLTASWNRGSSDFAFQASSKLSDVLFDSPRSRAEDFPVSLPLLCISTIFRCCRMALSSVL